MLVARANNIQSFRCIARPLRPRKRPQRSISRNFYANNRWSARPGPWPGAGAVTAWRRDGVPAGPHPRVQPKIYLIFLSSCSNGSDPLRAASPAAGKKGPNFRSARARFRLGPTGPRTASHAWLSECAESLQVDLSVTLSWVRLHGPFLKPYVTDELSVKPRPPLSLRFKFSETRTESWSGFCNNSSELPVRGAAALKGGRPDL